MSTSSALCADSDPAAPQSTTGTHSRPEYLIRTSELSSSAFDRRTHPIAAANHRYQLALGDNTGLTKTGVHLCRLPAGATSTTLHWHSHEDEWFYVLEAGEDAVALIWEPDSNSESPVKPGAAPSEGDTLNSEGRGLEAVVPRPEKVKAGDFLGFKGGVVRAHAFRAGESKDMVYLMGGSREPVDISHYPAEGKRMVIDMVEGGACWAVEDVHVRPWQRKKAPALE